VPVGRLYGNPFLASLEHMGFEVLNTFEPHVDFAAADWDQTSINFHIKNTSDMLFDL
jgi:hypothetical protein